MSSYVRSNIRVAHITRALVLSAVAVGCGDNRPPPEDNRPPPEDDHPPTVHDLAVSTEEDVPITVTVPAADEDGDPVTLTVGTAAHGTVTASGLELTYTPAANFYGEDVVSVTASAGGQSVSAEVRITVTPVNDAPVAVDDAQTTAEDTALAVAASTLTANDTDPEDSTLTVTAVSDAVNGSVALADGIVTFTPAADFNGTASFDYTVSDGELTDTGTVTVTVTAVKEVRVAVAQGDLHTCAILGTGEVKCWGYNTGGQLGLGDTRNRGDGAGEMGASLPAVDLGTGRTAKAITAGGLHTCAILDNDTVKCWGINSQGQLGLGDTRNRGDSPGEMGDALPVVDLGTNRTAVALTSGWAHTCALLDDATVKCWGLNDHGQLGLGDTTQRGDQAGQMGDALPAVALGAGRSVAAVDAGQMHVCALLDDATVKCWGLNAQGQLGLGDTDSRGDTPGELGDALPAVDLGTGRTVAVLNTGAGHTCAILDDRTTKCWGHNVRGELGLGDTNNRGDAADEMGDALPAVNLGSGRAAVSLSAANRTCAILDNDDLKCWGANSNGQLGYGDTNHRGDQPGEMGDALPAVNLGTGRTAVDLGPASSAQHVCAVLDNGDLKCWGFNFFGQLGLGDISSRGDQANEMGDNLPAVVLQ